MTNEWTKEIETLRARVACLEAALRDVYANHAGDPKSCGHDGYCRCGDEALRHAFKSGGTQSLDAVVSAAVAAERKRWATDAKTRVVFLHANGAMGLNDVLSAIGATEGGAP